VKNPLGGAPGRPACTQQEESAVKHQRLVVFALCLSLVALSGRASADLLIDENFDFNNLVDSRGPMVAVNNNMAMMWLHQMNAPFGMWMHMMDPSSGMAFVRGSMAMGAMSMVPWWNTLTYFMAMPSMGWGGDTLNFSFMFMAMVPMGGAAFFGVYGWPADASIDLESALPGSGGTELMSGQLGGFLVDAAGGLAAQANGWSLWQDSYFGDLSQFPFIGVAFTFGDAVGGGNAAQVLIDDVRLETNGAIPEPATMGLFVMGMAAAAYARRRKRALARSTGPPG
jgi:hypothetical protein